MAGKGSKRRRENYRAIITRWDDIDWRDKKLGKLTKDTKAFEKSLADPRVKIVGIF